MFRIYFREKAFRTLKKIERKSQSKINSALNDLSLSKSRDVEKIQGTEHGHRLRIGRWRILFALFSKGKQIEVVDIFLKKSKEDYRKRLKLFK
jgi:mRNA-degrading endonuclease RelE of RelBE toxin-antitoxin system